VIILPLKSKALTHCRWAIALAIVVLLAFISGCAPDQTSNFPNDTLWESAHFRYHTRDGDEAVCEAVLLQLERHFELMQAFLGFSWPQDRKVDYYKFLDQADYVSNSGCSADSDSCAHDSSVMSPHVLMEHELIHAYLAPLGLPPAFFVEGMASVLACSSPTATLIDPKPWKDVVLLPFSDRFTVYVEGPWFMGYLLYRYDPELLLSLYQRLDYQTASVDQIAATFASVYGEPLDAVWNEGLASSYDVRCVNLWPCSAPSLPLDGSQQSVATACDGSDNSRTFQLDAESDVLMSNDGPLFYAPVSCDQELPYSIGGDDAGAVSDTTIAPIAPGHYFVEAVSYQSATFEMRALAAKAYRQDCTDIEPIDLSTNEYPRGSFNLAIPNDESSWYVKLNRYVVWPGSASSMLVEECSDCSGSPVCQPIDSEGNTHPDSDGNVTLRLTSETPGPGYVTTHFLN